MPFDSAKLDGTITNVGGVDKLTSVDPLVLLLTFRGSNPPKTPWPGPLLTLGSGGVPHNVLVKVFPIKGGGRKGDLSFNMTEMDKLFTAGSQFYGKIVGEFAKSGFLTAMIGSDPLKVDLKPLTAVAIASTGSAASVVV
jgi:hypothetical protein